MSIELTWGVVQLETYPEKDGHENVVFTAHWNLTADDSEGHTAYVYGSIGVQTDPEADFTPYNELTKDQVIAWIKEGLGEKQVADYEAAVLRQIEDQINPPKVAPALPW